MSKTLFISDLHLSAGRPDITRRFQDFIAQQVQPDDALYILGDLFEYWPGDDILDTDEFSRSVCLMLQQLGASGTAISLLHGNRDLLLQQRFFETTGIKQLADPCHIKLGGQDICLSHGDALCTDDVDYQRFRQQVRTPAFQQQFLQKSLDERIAIIEGMRQQSAAAQMQKSTEIMDVNAAAVNDFFRQQDCSILIHGHTHRPAKHTIEVDGLQRQRLVLPDWYETGGYLQFDDATGFTLQSVG